MKDFLKKASEEKLPDGLLDRTMQRLEPEMKRRIAKEGELAAPWFSWLRFGLPVLALGGAAAAVAVFMHTNTGSQAPGSIPLRMGASMELLEESEVIADFELLRNIKVLERIEESETWRTIEAKAGI